MRTNDVSHVPQSPPAAMNRCEPAPARLSCVVYLITPDRFHGRSARSVGTPVPRRRSAARLHNRPMAMLEAVELRRVRLPLVTPFRTSLGSWSERDILLLRVLTTEGE